MDFIKSKLSAVGAFLAGVGLLSIILNILYVFHIASLEVRILMWIDNWGTKVGWVIRIGITVAGAALYLIGNISGKSSQE